MQIPLGDRHGHERVIAQAVMIVDVLVAERQTVYALGDDPLRPKAKADPGPRRAPSPSALVERSAAGEFRSPPRAWVA
jgi:hypothetical protein